MPVNQLHGRAPKYCRREVSFMPGSFFPPSMSDRHPRGLLRNELHISHISSLILTNPGYGGGTMVKITLRTINNNKHGPEAFIAESPRPSLFLLVPAATGIRWSPLRFRIPHRSFRRMPSTHTSTTTPCPFSPHAPLLGRLFGRHHPTVGRP